jgi:hypothetical protein
MGKGSCRHPIGGVILVITSWLFYSIPLLMQIIVLRISHENQDLITD